MMSDERAEYLASGSGEPPADRERLDLIRELLEAESTWAEPPIEVAERVLAEIEPESDHEGVSRKAGNRWWRRAPGIAAAVAAVVVVIVGLVGIFGDGGEETVVAMRGTELEADATGQAQVRATESGWWIRLDVEGLPAAPEGSYYEGWVWSEEGEGVSIGTFHLREGGEAITLWSGVDPVDYPSIWVTFEEEDGDPSASDQVVMVGHMPNQG